MDWSSTDGRLFATAAFRYALGRRTYIVSYIVRNLWAIARDLPAYDRDAMVREIDDAGKRGAIGDDCDRGEWERLRERLLQLNEAEEEMADDQT